MEMKKAVSLVILVAAILVVATEAVADEHILGVRNGQLSDPVLLAIIRREDKGKGKAKSEGVSGSGKVLDKGKGKTKSERVIGSGKVLGKGKRKKKVVAKGLVFEDNSEGSESRSEEGYYKGNELGFDIAVCFLALQLVPGLTTAVLTQLCEANPGINLVIPDFVMPSAPNDASSAPRLFIDQNGQSSKSGGTVTQVFVGSNFLGISEFEVSGL
uniref:Uncharacterized protein n=1 Tax=Chenopodium quinoa TaxID=63459 RepID=A0A803MAL7_CHEQI